MHFTVFLFRAGSYMIACYNPQMNGVRPVPREMCGIIAIESHSCVSNFRLFRFIRDTLSISLWSRRAQNCTMAQPGGALEISSPVLDMHARYKPHAVCVISIIRCVRSILSVVCELCSRESELQGWCLGSNKKPVSTALGTLRMHTAYLWSPWSCGCCRPVLIRFVSGHVTYTACLR